MAGFLSIEARGVDNVVETLTIAIKAAIDFSDVWTRDVIPFLQNMEEQQFTSEGAAGEPPSWAPLSARYAAKKFRAVGSQPLLVRYGALKQSLVGRTADSIREVKPQSLTYGSSLLLTGRYGHYLAAGWVAPGGRVVEPRKVIAPSQTQFADLANLVGRRYRSKLRGLK